MFITSAFGAAGCKSKSEREAEKEVQKLELAKARANEEEARKVSLARDDLNRRVGFFKAIAGEFAGQYTAYDSRIKPKVSMRISANLPVNIPRARPDTEAEVVAQAESITLSIDVQELSEQGDVLSTCRAGGVKPELSQGTFTFSCSERGYLIALDYLDRDDGSSIHARSESVTASLLQGRLSAVGFLNLEILSPFGRPLRGSMKRI